MVDLVDKLRKLGKYEIGLDDIQRLRKGMWSVSSYNLLFKLGALALQGIVVVPGAQQLYQGNVKEAAGVAALMGVIEATKYANHRLSLYVDGKYRTDGSPSLQS